MKMIVSRIIFCLFFMGALPLWAQSNFDENFKSGIQSYQNKKFDEAKSFFEKALILEPNNTSALTNLGLAVYNLGQKGLAIGLWRKALYIESSNKAASLALDFALEKTQIKEIPHKILFWESFRKQFFLGININVYQGMTLFLFVSGFWLLISFFGKRRKALINDEAPPSFPFLGVFFVLLFLCFASLTVLKIVDEENARGTITIEKIAALAGPKESEPSLFDLYEGHEVIIERVENDWVQVTYPGALTGWIPKKAIIQNFGHDALLN